MIINVDLNILMKANISIQEYLFLQLIKNKQKDLLVEYYSVFGKLVEPININKLIGRGWLLANDPNDKSFENFKVSNDFIHLTEIRLDDAIEELKSIYPKQTPSGDRKGLQADSDKWGVRYLKLINRDRALHEKILMCIEAEKIHRKNTKQEEYWALLATYVNNRRWETYIDDIDNFNKELDNIFSKDI